MATCTLCVFGKGLDLDACLSEISLRPDRVFPPGASPATDLGPVGRRVKAGFHVVVGKYDSNGLGMLGRDLQDFCGANREDLARIRGRPDVDDAFFFFAWQPPEVGESPAGLRLSPEILRTCGELGLPIEFVVFPVAGDHDDRKSVV